MATGQKGETDKMTKADKSPFDSSTDKTASPFRESSVSVSDGSSGLLTKPQRLTTADLTLLVHSLLAYTGKAKRNPELNVDMAALIDKVRSLDGPQVCSCDLCREAK
jgi:hypothetical protein